MTENKTYTKYFHNGDVYNFTIIPQYYSEYAFTSYGVTVDTIATLYKQTSSGLEFIKSSDDISYPKNKNFQIKSKLDVGATYQLKVWKYSSSTPGWSTIEVKAAKDNISNSLDPSTPYKLTLLPVKTHKLSGQKFYGSYERKSSSIDYSNDNDYFRYLPCFNGYWQITSSGNFNKTLNAYNKSGAYITGKSGSGNLSIIFPNKGSNVIYPRLYSNTIGSYNLDVKFDHQVFNVGIYGGTWVAKYKTDNDMGGGFSDFGYSAITLMSDAYAKTMMLLMNTPSLWNEVKNAVIQELSVQALLFSLSKLGFVIPNWGAAVISVAMSIAGAQLEGYNTEQLRLAMIKCNNNPSSNEYVMIECCWVKSGSTPRATLSSYSVVKGTQFVAPQYFYGTWTDHIDPDIIEQAIAESLD